MVAAVAIRCPDGDEYQYPTFAFKFFNHDTCELEVLNYFKTGETSIVGDKLISETEFYDVMNNDCKDLVPAPETTSWLDYVPSATNVGSATRKNTTLCKKVHATIAR